MSARTLIESAVEPPISRERMDELYHEVESALNSLRPGRGWRIVTVVGNNANEAQYIAHVAGGLCSTQFEQKLPDGRIPVKLTATSVSPSQLYHQTAHQVRN